MATERRAPARGEPKLDEAGRRAIESLSTRGDLSGLSPDDRAKLYTRMCEGLGLNPHMQPFAFLRLSGKEVLYATRGATDQLAAIHGLNREIVDGPKVIDLAGTKLVYAVCRATHPNGRVETATATVALADPVNVLMRAETKAKRRATLSILGLAILDETEVDAGGTRGEGVDLSKTGEPSPPAGPLDAFLAGVPALADAPAVVTYWIRHRPAVAALEKPARAQAFEALTRRLGELGVQDPEKWLRAALAEEDARAKAAAQAADEGGAPRG